MGGGPSLHLRRASLKEGEGGRGRGSRKFSQIRSSGEEEQDVGSTSKIRSTVARICELLDINKNLSCSQLIIESMQKYREKKSLSAILITISDKIMIVIKDKKKAKKY